MEGEVGRMEGGVSEEYKYCNIKFIDVHVHVNRLANSLIHVCSRSDMFVFQLIIMLHAHGKGHQ